MRVKALMLCFLVATLSLSGCFGAEEIQEEEQERPIVDQRVFVTDGTGASVDAAPLEMEFTFSDVWETGKEPSIGITSSGCMFFIAMEKPMRSCDAGKSWENTAISLIFVKKSWISGENTAILSFFDEKSWKSWGKQWF